MILKKESPEIISGLSLKRCSNYYNKSYLICKFFNMRSDIFSRLN